MSAHTYQAVGPLTQEVVQCTIDHDPEPYYESLFLIPSTLLFEDCRLFLENKHPTLKDQPQNKRILDEDGFEDTQRRFPKMSLEQQKQLHYHVVLQRLHLNQKSKYMESLVVTEVK